MATMKLLILSLAYVCASAFPYEPTVPPTRNTIFADERLEGEIFEDIETYENLATSRNIDSSAYRLPGTTRPSHYNVLWAIDISRMIYSGNVEIQLYATQANVSQIVLHSNHTEFTSLTLLQGNTIINQTYTVAEDDTHLLVVTLTNGVLNYNADIPVIYSLIIDFVAPMRFDMYGIYRSWYRNSYNQTEVSRMATTQFQATAARYAFPCYDEPSFKATFDVVIRRPVGFRSWFCTRQSQTLNSTAVGFEDDYYYRTPVMSTYLLALIVAEYDSIDHYENNILKYDVIARPSAISTGQGQYAFDVGLELLAEMNNHTALDFYELHPTIKMTQAAIPDFGAGAMENWGLLTYREAYLLYDENHTSSYYKQLIAYILSHEIAHMWFGNLVTCDWWDVLWLNEGFARYYQYFLTHWVEDYMGLETRFITEQVHASLLSDSVNTHPLSHSGVGSPSSVSDMFSTITYNKGASIIRMTEHLMGFDVHRQGLRNYLSERRFSVALPIDLFNHLQAAAVSAGAISQYGSDFNIIDYYRSWTEQAGHPVLSVQINHQTGDMTIYQRRFNINTGYSAIDTNYIIPITFATASNPDFANTKPSHIVRDSITVINRGSVGDEWVIFNKQQTGFYRINYDDYTWDLITIALRGDQRTRIHEYNRAQIVNDVFQFARAGLMTYTRAFNILSFLEFETEYAPWVAAITGFTWLRNRLAGTPQLDSLHQLMSRWATNVMNRVTYYPRDGETFMESYLRYQVATMMCAIDVAECRDAAVEQYSRLRDNGTEVPVDSRNWVYCNALRRGGADVFNALRTRFIQHNVYTEKILILGVLGCTNDEASLTTLLNEIIQDNYMIRRQDYNSAMSGAVSGNENNTQIAFRYIQNNLRDVITAFNTSTTPLSYVSARLRTIDEVNAFQSWATANQDILGDTYTAVYNGAESSRQSILWAVENQADLNSYFVNGYQPISVSTTLVPEVTTVTTVTPSPIIEPTTPSMPVPDSAVTNLVSIFALALVALVNIIV